MKQPHPHVLCPAPRRSSPWGTTAAVLGVAAMCEPVLFFLLGVTPPGRNVFCWLEGLEMPRAGEYALVLALPVACLLCALVAVGRHERQPDAWAGVMLAVPAGVMYCVLLSGLHHNYDSHWCQNQLREVGLAVRAYAVDYDHRFPPADRWASATFPYVTREGFDVTAKERQFAKLEDPHLQGFWRQEALTAGQGYQRHHCTEDYRPRRERQHDGDLPTSYTFNVNLSGARDTDWANSRALVLVFDGDSLTGEAEALAFRHGREKPVGSVCYADGHTRRLLRDPNPHAGEESNLSYLQWRPRPGQPNSSNVSPPPRH